MEIPSDVKTTWFPQSFHSPVGTVAQHPPFVPQLHKPQLNMILDPDMPMVRSSLRSQPPW